MPFRAPLRALLRGALGALALLAAVLAGLLGYAQTAGGKRYLADLIAGAASGPGRVVTLEGLDGFLPFDVRLGRASVADGRGVWLEVADAELAWAPARLLRGVVDVTTLGARAVVLRRLPPPAPEPAVREPFRLPALPALPASLPGVELRRLHVDRIELGEPVLGQAAAFNLEGSAGTADQGRTVRASVDLRRTDQRTASAALDARLDLPAMALALDVRADETGRLLAAATGRPEAGALRLRLAGNGRLADWRGRFELDAEGLAAARADLALAYGGERRRVALDGGVELAPGLLPPDAAAAVGPRVDFGLAAGEVAPERFALERLDARAAAASLAGRGTADLGAGTVAADLDLAVPDLAKLAGLAATPLAGRATLRATASGPTVRPTLRLAADGAGLAAASATVDRLRLTAELVPRAPLGQGGPPPAALTLSGFADGAAWDGRRLGDQGRLDLDLAADLPAEGPARVARLELRSPLATLTGRASGDPRTWAGEGRVDLAVPDLAAVLRGLAPDAAPPGEIAGSVRLGADVTVAERAKRIGAVLDGGASGLRLPAGLAALVGPAPTLAAAGGFEPGVAAAVDRLELAGAAFRLEGNPRLGLADRALGGGVRLAVPDLKPLAGLAGQPLEGALDVAATLGGTLAAPDLRLEATGRALVAAGQRVDRLTLAATARGAPASPAGRVRLTAERGRVPLALATDYRLAEDRTLTLSALTLEGPGARLAGALDLALDGPRATGGVSGQVRDLAALAPWYGQPVSGAVDLDLRLEAPAGRQDAKLGVAVSGAAGGFGRLRSARLDAAARDLLGRPALDAGLLARGFAGPSLQLGEATLSAKGPPTALALDLAAAGDQAGRPFRLRSAATVDAASARKTVRLASLDAAFAGQPIRLTAPATLTLAEGGGYALDRLALAVAGGSVSAGGELGGGGRVRAEAAADGFPLALLETFGGPSLRGTASARASLAGTTAAPQARAELTARDLALDAALQPKPDLRLEATLAGGRLDARLGLSELGSRPVAASASLPARFRLEPFALDLAADAPLTGAVQGQVDLSRVARVAALQGVQLAGSLNLDLAVRGTLTDPALGGTLALSKGVVQDVASGVSLRDVALAASGQGRRLAIDRLTASDRAGGTLTASGWAGLEPGGGPAYALEAKAGTLRVLDNDLGSVILSGALRASGTAESARVGGKLTLDRADIAIPEGGGPSVPVIEVREVGTGPRAGPERPEPRASPAAPFDLRLAVAVDAPARLFVRGRGLDSEWGGAISVDGPATAPEIVGELEFRRGFLDLLDKRFTIRRGVISFVGSTPPVPMLDLEASARSAEIEAVVKLAGPAVDPKLTLTSEPVLPQDEILSRLLFGSSVARLTPVQGLRLAAAVDTLRGGGGLSSVLSALRKGLGVDTLDVQGGETAQESTARAGKYVSDKVYVEVEKGVAEGTGTARVKVDLTPNLSVGTEVNERSQTGVGLEWRYDY